jgi:tetratricopeptide (TPR) repeat protein
LSAHPFAAGGPGPDPQATRTSAGSGALAVGGVVAGRYRILALAGVGGMGMVYRAHDEQLDVDVALKVLRPEVASDPGFRERFRRELLLARQVSHRNAVRIHDLGAEGELLFLTMDFVPGQSLRAVLEQVGALAPRQAVAIARQLAAALAAAHAEGVVHRDLKPANILVDDTGRAFITDFGVARSLAVAGPTQTGGIVGTPDYLSPEQARGEAVDGRSDIYALGLLLFEMLSGRLPFGGDSYAERLAQRIGGRARDLRDVGVAAPARVRAVVRRCLERNPARRYQSAEQLLAALDALPARALPETAAGAGRQGTGERGGVADGSGSGSPGGAERSGGPAADGGPAAALGQEGASALHGGEVGGFHGSALPGAGAAGGPHGSALPGASGAEGPDGGVPLRTSGSGGARSGAPPSVSGAAGAAATAPRWASSTPSRWTHGTYSPRWASWMRWPYWPRWAVRGGAAAALLLVVVVVVALLPARGRGRLLGWMGLGGASSGGNREVSGAAPDRAGQVPPGAPAGARGAGIGSPSHVVAVLPFAEQTGRADFAWSSAGVAEMLTAALAESPRLRVVDSLRLLRAVDDLKLPHGGLPESELRQVAELVEADRLVTGRVRAVAGGLRLDLDLVAADRPGAAARPLHAEARDPSQIFRLVGELGEQLRRELEAGEAAAPSAGLTASSAAMASYSEGLGRLARADSLGALPALERAVAADPAFTAAWVRLAGCYQALGYAEKAQAAAARAAATPGAAAGRLGYESRAQRELSQGNPEAAEAVLRQLVGRYPNDLEARLELAEACGRQGKLDAAVAASRDVVRADPNHPRAWYLLGRYLIQQGKARQAIDEALVHAMVVQNRLGSEQGRADVLNALGVGYQELGDLDRAAESYQQSAAIRRRIDDRRGYATSLKNLATLALVRGAGGEAERDLAQALAILQAIGDRAGVAELENAYGGLEEERGRYDRALDSYRRALELRRDLGDKLALAESLTNVGYTYHLLGRYDDALVYWQQALDLDRSTGDLSGVVTTTQSIGQLQLAQGKWTAALKSFLDTLGESRKLGFKAGAAVSTGNLGRVAQYQGRYQAALASYHEALGLVRELGDPRGETEFTLFEAEALQEIGMGAAAGERLARAAKWLQGEKGEGEKGEGEKKGQAGQKVPETGKSSGEKRNGGPATEAGQKAGEKAGSRKDTGKQAASGQAGKQVLNGQAGEQVPSGQAGEQAASGQAGKRVPSGQAGENLTNGQTGQQMASSRSGENRVGGQKGGAGGDHGEGKEGESAERGAAGGKGEQGQNADQLAELESLRAQALLRAGDAAAALAAFRLAEARAVASHGVVARLKARLGRALAAAALGRSGAPAELRAAAAEAERLGHAPLVLWAAEGMAGASLAAHDAAGAEEAARRGLRWAERCGPYARAFSLHLLLARALEQRGSAAARAEAARERQSARQELQRIESNLTAEQRRSFEQLPEVRELGRHG